MDGEPDRDLCLNIDVEVKREHQESVVRRNTRLLLPIRVDIIESSGRRTVFAT